MKINISVNDELVKRVDEYAERNYTNRSAVFAQGANAILLQDLIPYQLGQIAVAFKRIADNNAIDEESKKQLEEFSKLAELLGGKR